MKNIFENLISQINKQQHLIISFTLFIFFILISYITKDYRLLGCDMAEYLNNPLRILNGELPYRDFWLLFSPGEVYFPALIYKIFGLNTDFVRLFSIIFSSLTAIIGFYIGRMLLKRNFDGIIFSFLVFFTSVISYYEGHDYNHLYFTFTLLSSLFLIKYLTDEKRLFLFLSGIFIGIALAFRLYEAGAALTAFVLVIIIFLISFKKKLGYSIKSILIFFAGISIILIALAISFNSMLPTLFNEVVVESIDNGTSMDLPYFYEVSTQISAFGNENLGSLSSLPNILFRIIRLMPTILYYLIPFISLIILILFIFSKPDRKNLCLSLVFCLWGLISFPKGLGRSDIAHLAPSVTPILLFIFYLIRTYKYQENFQKNIKYINIIGVPVIYIMLLTAINPIIKFVSLVKNPPVYVNTRHGTVPLKDSREAADFKSVIDFIEKNSNEGDYILVTPWDAPPIYALTNRKNPTFYDSLTDLIVRHSDEKQKKICEDIRSHNTKIIIHNADWGHDNKPEQQFRTACPVLQEYIENDYKLVQQYGQYSIYLPL